MAYSNYKGQCIGRLLHFLYSYNSRDADHCIFHGDGKITLHRDNGPIVAHGYTWNNDGDGDIPTFQFSDEYDYLSEIQNRKQQEIVNLEVLMDRSVYSKKAEQDRKEQEQARRSEKLRADIMNLARK